MGCGGGCCPATAGETAFPTTVCVAVDLVPHPGAQKHGLQAPSPPESDNVVLGCGGVQFRAGPALFVISLEMHGLAEFNYVASQCESSLVYMCWRKMSAQDKTRTTFANQFPIH